MTIKYNKSLTSSTSQTLTGQVIVPGDKSISHRSIMFASQALGTTRITGLLAGDDVLRTIDAFKAMGVKIKQEGDDWVVDGVGLGGLSQPDNIIDMGNSGTAVRLLMGVMASYPYKTTFTGDESLRGRPMGRIANPLRKMGAKIESREVNNKELLPLTINGYSNMMPIEYKSPVASAQLKSAILFAGMNIAGDTTVIEPSITRDHSENMMKYLGIPVKVEDKKDGRHVTVSGHHTVTARDINVPSDPSSAAFFVVAALITPNSELHIPNVCINPLRTGLYRTLFEMGANIAINNQRNLCGELVADLVVKHSQLKPANIPARRVPSMIDEFPVFAIAASYANGTSQCEGLHELRVKESDRLSAIADGLKLCGVSCDEGEDTLAIHGKGAMEGGATIATHHDHRIAMSFLVGGLQSKQPITVDSGAMISTSFPGFIEMMQAAGATIS